jgi:glutamate-ammonia-ligase adenylyltransferase
MRTIAFGPAPSRAAAAQEIRRVRERVLLEMAREKEDRFDIKLGRGGLLELEFVVQFNQLLYGHSLGGLAQSRDTKTALLALTEGGAISPADGAALSEAHTFLRRLEARVRVSRADAAHGFDTRHASLETLARRMGLRGRPFSTAGQELVARYREHAGKVRAIYERVFVDDAG